MSGGVLPHSGGARSSTLNVAFQEIGVPCQMSASAIESNKAEAGLAHSQGAPWVTQMFTSAALPICNRLDVMCQCRNAEFDQQNMAAPQIEGGL
jgi:hypothetical protein